MASTEAIAATSRCILRLLERAYDKADFRGTGASFELYQARHSPRTPGDWSLAFGVSLFLYHVEPNLAARNGRPRRDIAGTAVLPPLPVDLHYLVTAWATDAADQHLLLGWAMRTLQDTPVLPAAALNVAYPTTFGPGETVELSAEQLSRQDLAPLWELMKPNQQPSAAYVARMVPLASKVVVDEHEPVQTRVFDMRKPVVGP
jgi:hypothetical protein